MPASCAPFGVIVEVTAISGRGRVNDLRCSRASSTFDGGRHQYGSVVSRRNPPRLRQPSLTLLPPRTPALTAKKPYALAVTCGPKPASVFFLGIITFNMCRSQSSARAVTLHGSMPTLAAYGESR